MNVPIKPMRILRPRGLLAAWSWALLAMPATLAFILVHRGWLLAPRERVSGDLNLWGWLEGTQHWYWHIAHDLFHGTSPFVNNFKAFPEGNNHLALHGNFGDALLAAPLQWAFDFPLSYNLTVVLFTLLNCYGLYRLIRAFGGSSAVAAVSLPIVVLHPYFLSQLEEGRLTQYLVGWAFLALAESVPILRQKGHRMYKLAFFWTATFVSFWFYGVFLSLSLLGLGTVMLWGRPMAAKWPLAKAFGWTLLASFPFGMPLLYQVLQGAGIPGVSFLELPSPERWVTTSATLLDTVSYSPSEFGPVLLPALLIAGALATLVLGMGTNQGTRPDGIARGAEVRALALCALGAWLLALGPFLVWPGAGGPVSTALPLPWLVLYVAVPFFSRLSYPVMVFPFLLVPVLLLALRAYRAMGSVAVGRKWGDWLTVGVLLLVIVELVLRAPPAVSADPYTVPGPYQWLATDTASDALLEYPFGYTDCSRLYQPIHGKCLMGTEGRFEDLRQWEPVDKLFTRQPALEKLSAVQRGEPIEPISAAELEGLYREGFDYLVFRPISCGRQPPFPQGWTTETHNWLAGLLGPPVREGDGVAVFELPVSGMQRAVCGQ